MTRSEFSTKFKTSECCLFFLSSFKWLDSTSASDLAMNIIAKENSLKVVAVANVVMMNVSPPTHYFIN